MEKVEKLIKLFPVFAILLIFFGFINLYYFYSSFGVNIYSYLNSSEIILSFLPDLQIFMAWFGVLIVSILFISLFSLLGRPKKANLGKDSEEETSLAENSEATTKETAFRELPWKEKIKTLWKTLTNRNLLSFYFLIGFSYLAGFNPCEEPDTAYPLLYFWVLFVIYLIQKIVGSNMIGNFLSVFILTIGFMLFFAFRSECKAKRVMKGKTKIDISFHYEGEKIGTDTSTFYIGATQNYIFLYDTLRKETSLFNKSKISNIRIKKKN